MYNSKNVVWPSCPILVHESDSEFESELKITKNVVGVFAKVGINKRYYTKSRGGTKLTLCCSSAIPFFKGFLDEYKLKISHLEIDNIRAGNMQTDVIFVCVNGNDKFERVCKFTGLKKAATKVNTISLGKHRLSILSDIATKTLCFECKNECSKRCSCGRAFYCSKVCQTKDWPIHKSTHSTIPAMTPLNANFSVQTFKISQDK